jgi:hypothetical protein
MRVSRGGAVFRIKLAAAVSAGFFRRESAKSIGEQKKPLDPGKEREAKLKGNDEL